MDEPPRIGLTKEANDYLDEMLDSLNSEVEGPGLIKFDLYRLAVALGVKSGKKPDPISGKSDSALRVNELDPDKALFIAVQSADLYEQGEPVYRAVERMGEQGVREFYKAYQSNMGRLPWDKLLSH